MSTERSRRAQHLQDKQTTLCPETNLLRSRGERSRLDRKLSTTAPEHCYSCLGALLQRLRKVAPKPPEKAYSPLRKNSKLRKTMTARLLRSYCKAVTRLLQSCYVVAAKLSRKSGYLPDKSHQPTEQRKESRREKPSATRQETEIWLKGNSFWQEKLPKSPFLPPQKEEMRARKALPLASAHGFRL